MLKIYGSSMSRTSRCLWAAEEVGVKYEQNPTPIAEAKSPANLKLNPNGHIPVIDEFGQEARERQTRDRRQGD